MTSNLKERLKLDRVINASGKMTILGGSRLERGVLDAMNEGASQFYVMSDLMEQSNQYLQDLLKVEAAWLVSSASSGIAQSVAAAINQGNYKYVMNPYDETLVRNKVVIAKGHIVDYGTSIEVPIRMGGAKIVEAGYANGCTVAQMESVIDSETAAIIYVKSHHAVQKSMPKMEDVIALAKKYELPIIIDAAAEGDLNTYADMGADAVIYSGTKALEGPTSGVVIGSTTFISWLKAQGQGIGRVMKIGKENIFGLLEAITEYVNQSAVTLEQQEARLKPFNEAINELAVCHAKTVQDGAGRPILRSQIQFDKSVDMDKLSKGMKAAPIRIYTRDYRINENIIEIDIRDVSEEELDIITNQIKENI